MTNSIGLKRVNINLIITQNTKLNYSLNVVDKNNDCIIKCFIIKPVHVIVVMVSTSKGSGEFAKIHLSRQSLCSSHTQIMDIGECSDSFNTLASRALNETFGYMR